MLHLDSVVVFDIPLIQQNVNKHVGQLLITILANVLDTFYGQTCFHTTKFPEINSKKYKGIHQTRSIVSGRANTHRDINVQKGK